MKKWKLIITFLVLIFAMSCSPGKKRSEMPGAKLNLSLFPINFSRVHYGILSKKDRVLCCISA